MTATTGPPAARTPQPGVVLLACWLLGGVAVARVVGALGAFYAIPEFRWFYAGQFDDTAAPEVVGLVLFGLVSLLAGAT